MAANIISFVDGMKVGLGYNRLTGDVLSSPAVQGSSISAVQGAGGQQVSIDCVTIQDVESLHKSLGISVDAGGSYLGFSGSAKVEYVNTCDFSSFSTYVMVRVSVQDAFESIDSPVFSPDANDLLVKNNPDRFRQRFGDSFIAGVKKGGEYFAIYQLTGSDQQEKEALSVSVHAAFNGLIASAELNTSIQTATSSSRSHLQVQVHIFRQGTIGTADLNLEDIMRTARDFPVSVSGDKAFPYAVLLQDYQRLKSPNDQFNYYDLKNQQDVLEDLAKRRFEFLTLRDDLKYILKHSDDFQNTDGTAVNRDELSKNYDEVINAINTMETEAKACSQDASRCQFTTFEVAKIKLPMMAKGPEDDLAAKGEAIVNQDPLALAIRNGLSSAASRRGFNIGMAVAKGQTLPGPGKQRIHDSLRSDEQDGYSTAVSYTLQRNNNPDFAARGAAIVKANPDIAAARAKVPPGLYWLGFDIGTGIFGDPTQGAQGNTLMGPGSEKIRASLDPDGQQGFNDARDFNWKKRHVLA
jgi:hypothetical protein